MMVAILDTGSHANGYELTMLGRTAPTSGITITTATGLTSRFGDDVDDTPLAVRSGTTGGPPARENAVSVSAVRTSASVTEVRKRRARRRPKDSLLQVVDDVGECPRLRRRCRYLGP